MPLSRAPETTLARRLGLFDAVMIVLSGMIGSGIFINPAVVARAVGTPGLILAVWIIGGVIALCGALVFAELGALLPHAGGQYAYFRDAFHPALGFLHGWSILLIVQSAATAAVAVAFAQYLLRLLHLPAALSAPVAGAALAALAGFHALGVRPGAAVLGALTLLKTLALGALIGGALLFYVPGPAPAPPPPAAAAAGPGLLSLLLAGLVPAMFAYGGWQNVNYVAEEVRDPRRVLPRAILLGVLCVVAVYLAANVAYLRVLSAPELGQSATPAADVAARIAGEAGARAMGALIVVSTFGFLNLALLSAPRVYFAMARDGLLPAAFGRVHPRFRTPVAAILLQGALAAIYAATSRYERLLAYAVFADWLFFALAGAALLQLRRRLPDAPRPLSVPLLVPALFIVSALAVSLHCFVTAPADAGRGAALILLGLPAYALWRRFTRPRPGAPCAARPGEL